MSNLLKIIYKNIFRIICKYKTNSDIVLVYLQVVVIIVIWIISILVIYMLFLMCLDPLLNKRVKANYQEHTNEDVHMKRYSSVKYSLLVDDNKDSDWFVLLFFNFVTKFFLLFISFVSLNFFISHCSPLPIIFLTYGIVIANFIYLNTRCHQIICLIVFGSYFYIVLIYYCY